MFFKSGKFWAQAVDRALRSAAQSVVLLIAADQFNALDYDWTLAGGFALGGFALSLVTSVATAPLGDDKESPQVL